MLFSPPKKLLDNPWRYMKDSSQGHGPCPKCPSSDAFYVWNDGHGHCFSCGFHKSSEPSLDTIRNSLTKEKKGRGVFLPDDCSTEFRTDAADWLWQYNLTSLEIRKNRIQWSERLSSLIFPVFGEENELLLWQMRYFGQSSTIPKWKTFGDVQGTIHLPTPHPANLVVLVEDIVSAIKVSKVTNATPLFGSAIDDRRIHRLNKLFQRCRVWLDPDKKQEAVRMALKLSEIGLRSDVILSDRDPKCFSAADIRELVGVHGNV